MIVLEKIKKVKHKMFEIYEVIMHPHVRHKALFATFYSVHLYLEHTGVESAGVFYYVVEILHTVM